MHGTLLWFNETRDDGVIETETGLRLPVDGRAFAAGPPEGRCSGKPVTFDVRENGDGAHVERVVLVEDAVSPRRARRRSSARG
jgi:cold shock CspA family protein